MTSGLAPDGAGGPHVFVDDLGDPELGRDDHHHLAKVRRVRDGDAITLSDGAGSWVAARFARSPEIAGDVVFVDRPSPSVTIAMAAVKSDRTSYAVQKLTELGVDRIVLMETARSVVRWKADRAGSALDRLRAVARSAAEQSRQVWLPEIAGPVSVAELCSVPGAALAQQGGAPPSLDTPTLLVGPEGGWAPEELAGHAATVGLGGGVLRAETAAVVAGSLLTALRAGIVSARQGCA